MCITSCMKEYGALGRGTFHSLKTSADV